MMELLKLEKNWAIPHAVIALICGTLPFVLDVSGVNLAIEIVCFITLAQMWNLLAGYAGLMSIGQQLFVGIGGYTLFLTAITFQLPIITTIPLSGLASAVVSIPAIWLCMRLQGPYFAIATWVIAEAVMLLFSKLSFLGGASGLSLPISVVRDLSTDADTRSIIFWGLASSLMLISTFSTHLLLRTRYGLALTAIRDNQEGARSVGVNERQVRISIFVLTAFFTGLAGAILFLQKLRISPSAAFDLSDFTATVIFIVVIGGIGHLESAFVGTLVYFAMRSYLSELGPIYLMLLGTLAILMMLFAPAGIWGAVNKRFDISIFLTRRLYTNTESH
jgi:branched-chain amino acid transport system permease protein